MTYPGWQKRGAVGGGVRAMTSRVAKAGTGGRRVPRPRPRRVTGPMTSPIGGVGRACATTGWPSGSARGPARGSWFDPACSGPRVEGPRSCLLEALPGTRAGARGLLSGPKPALSVVRAPHGCVGPHAPSSPRGFLLPPRTSPPCLRCPLPARALGTAGVCAFTGRVVLRGPGPQSTATPGAPTAPG
nr:translation initiation factor IF-2-like [Pongo pygmaeus]